MNNPIDKLVHELGKLPGIGERTAMRLALHILREPSEYGLSLAKALQETVGKVHFCARCCNIATEELCPICQKHDREDHVVCVVEDIADLQAVEKTYCFRGRYHVLHGALSPIDGIGPEELKIAQLEKRLREDPAISELIIATNPNVTGDATALYLARLLAPYRKKITRLASGIPVGSHIEFIDRSTLSRAFESRREYG
ncbi:MAG: recombination protein RecR [uncultured bacterium]|nr:MAG: recombination protein RecR [uncultured bacterium]HLD45828.1 recombination mediator RecR [bacterium]